MVLDIYTISSYAPRPCGIATFTRSFLGGLNSYTGEVGSKYVFAIDNSNESSISYDPLVESVIKQLDPNSWIRNAGKLLVRSSERKFRKPVVVLQHEFGLDGKDAKGNNYVTFANIIKAANIPIYTYLHTVLDNPNEHQLNTICDLANSSDKLIVTTDSAIEILSKKYGIETSKVKHIDHGIRMIDSSKYNREDMKKKYGVEKTIISTLGLKSKNKGLEYGIESFGKFLNNSSNKNVTYLIAGQWHEGFVKQEGGKYYREALSKLNKTLKSQNLKFTTLKNLKNYNDLGKAINENSVVFLDKYIDEDSLLDFYGLTDIKMLPYRSQQQISSGILADTIGSGRAVISTKFLYSLDLLSDDSKKAREPGLFIDANKGKGVLVDLEKGKDKSLFDPNTEQMAEGLEYLVSHENERLEMERRAFERGHRMRWDIVAGEFIRDVQFLYNLRR
jgi:glycosyltransferase involved in cell wall biosynthesis